MLPAFPHFKKVTVSDRAAVEAFTQVYPPYSDFNFTSLWAWDTGEKRMVSQLNGNLVVRFTDYSTEEPFLSFLGTSETERTARALIEFCKDQGLPQHLRLMPEISVKDMRQSVLQVAEDRDNFDYIFSVSTLSAMRGESFRSKRNLVNRFLRDYKDAHLEVIDLVDTSAQKKIIDVLHTWEKGKIQTEKEYELEHEKEAIERLFETAKSHKLVVFGLFIKGELEGFSVDEILPQGYSICHFWKTDILKRGAYEFIMHKKARHFETIDVQFINFEQDLGIKGLRDSKQLYRPTTYLKKYRVSLREV